MAGISSLGVGSGLDVNSILTQMLAVEKRPLEALEVKATAVQAQVSALGQIQSQFAELTDLATKMADPDAWAARTATSTNPSAATVTATATANPASLSLDVDQLALTQSASSQTIATGTAVGAGTLTLRLGTWSAAAAEAAAAAAASAADAAAATAATAATASTTAGTAASDALALDATAATDLANLALTKPSVAAYSSAYTAWANAVAANDGTSLLQTAETNALALRDSARSDLGLTDPTALVDADALTATADASNASSLKGTARVAAANSVTADALSVSAAAASTAAAAAVAAGTRGFAPAGGSADVAIEVLATDTVAMLAAKINAANAGVVATAFNDGTQDRLLLSSKDTGAASGFRLTAKDTAGAVLTGDTGLARVAFDPFTGAFGMASAGLTVQHSQDAKARINGLAVTSASNTLDANMPGVSIELLNTTTVGYDGSSPLRSPLTLTIRQDVSPVVKNVDDFVAAYNTLTTNLKELTKYDAATDTTGVFQADSAIVNMQNMLRNLVGSSSMGTKSQYLADVGIETKEDGTLSVNLTKMTPFANDGITFKQLFTNNTGNALTNGFALKFRDLGEGMAATGGTIPNKSAALQTLLENNTEAQTKINSQATLFEERLRKRYGTLDAQMTKWKTLSNYATQQNDAWKAASNS